MIETLLELAKLVWLVGAGVVFGGMMEKYGEEMKELVHWEQQAVLIAFVLLWPLLLLLYYLDVDVEKATDKIFDWLGIL